jgi:hypothetical protein
VFEGLLLALPAWIGCREEEISSINELYLHEKRLDFLGMDQGLENV